MLLFIKVLSANSYKKMPVLVKSCITHQLAIIVNTRIFYPPPMASFLGCLRRRPPPPPIIILTEPGGSNIILEPEYNELKGTANVAYLADESEGGKRRKSSFALADKIWELEDRKNQRQRIFYSNSDF